MINIYGIKNCDSVKKAIKFLKNNNLEYNLIDFKKESCDKEKIKHWVQEKGIEIVLNKKGTTYRTMGLSKMNLSEDELITTMSENNLLIKRPVIEYEKNILIGFDENTYNNTF